MNISNMQNAGTGFSRASSWLNPGRFSESLIRLLCINGFGVFRNATSENATLVLRKAMREYGVPAQMPSDNGRYFAAGKIDGSNKKWKPTIFEQDLLAGGILLITARPYHPQTNGNLERLF